MNSMNRRNFLGTILAIGAAPAIVRAASLMRCRGVTYELANGVLRRPLVLEIGGAYVGAINLDVGLIGWTIGECLGGIFLPEHRPHRGSLAELRVP